MSEIDIDSMKFEDREPQETLKWAIEQFYPKIRLASSFGPEDLVLIHMATAIKPDLEIFFLETGFHFKETEELKERLKNEWHLNLLELYPEITLEEQNEKYDNDLYKTDPDLCCKIRKVKPLEMALSDVDAWITGLRREQAPTRKDTPVVGKDIRGLWKISPLVKWSEEDVWNYIRENNIPYNPLHDRGYPSIGCEPCTKQVKPGEDPRSGRWADKEKIECGLH